ncbi:hypothetical protein [Paludifilum halophilum]|uniref:hypothetical protein n=1 Tax=Paludifilum halophilum TaxID=1642702 RepID=UPI000B93F61E|nr:hypothetical protein [Paludifilum halophilum]
MKFKKSLPVVRLQFLIIYPGWTVTYNKFIELNPLQLSPDDENWLLFTQDLLQLHCGEDLLLDLGWYPEADPSGQYRLELIKNTNWEKPLLSFSSRDKSEITELIERITWEY